MVAILRPKRASNKIARGSAQYNASPAHLFAYFFWRNRKSRPSETQLRCRRKHGSSVKPDRRADVHPQGVGRIRSAPSSLTAALAIGPYRGGKSWRSRKSGPPEARLQCNRKMTVRCQPKVSGSTEPSAPTEYFTVLPPEAAPASICRSGSTTGTGSTRQSM